MEPLISDEELERLLNQSAEAIVRNADEIMQKAFFPDDIDRPANNEAPSPLNHN